MKRPARLADTPASVSVVGANELRLAGVDNAGELGRQIPGLNIVDEGPSRRRFVLRGIQSSGESTVGVYYDETPVSGAVGATNDAGGSTPALGLFDVDRVEVARGPQGTLYGSGAMGGTVRVYFRKPQFETGASVETGISTVDGGSDGFMLAGVGNVVVSPDRLAIRAAVARNRRGGYVDNPLLARVDLGETTADTARIALRFVPDQSMTLDLAAHYEDVDGIRPLWMRENGPYDTSEQALRSSRDTLRIYSATLEWKLAAGNLVATASRAERDFDHVFGDVSGFLSTYIDNPPACAFFAGGGSPCSGTVQTDFNAYVESLIPSALYPVQDVETTSVEIRYSTSSATRWQWTVGSFASLRDTRVENLGLYVEPVSGRIAIPPLVQYRRLVDDRLAERALFGELGYDLGDRFELSSGMRLFRYKRESAGETTVPLALIGSMVSPYERNSAAEDGTVISLGLAYRPGSRMLAYARAAEGFRAGGVNQVLGLPETLTPFESDSLRSYEIGFRRSIGASGNLNVSAYDIDWHDMQVTGSTPNGAFRFISNAGAASIRGLELEVSVQPIRALVLTAGAAYTRAQLSEDQNDANIMAPGVAGDRIPYIPRRTASLRGEYRLPRANGWELVIGFGLSHTGERSSEFRPDSPFYRRLPGYVLASASAGLSHSLRGLEIRLIVDNATNNTAELWAGANVATLGRTLVSSSPPRTTGLSFAKTF